MCVCVTVCVCVCLWGGVRGCVCVCVCVWGGVIVPCIRYRVKGGFVSEVTGGDARFLLNGGSVCGI